MAKLYKTQYVLYSFKWGQKAKFHLRFAYIPCVFCRIFCVNFAGKIKKTNV
jgi:hypothetical protein